MPSNDHTLRNTIIGTVVGGVLLSILAWLFDVLFPTLTWLGNGFTEVWTWSIARSAFQNWMVLLLIVVLVYFVISKVRIVRESNSNFSNLGAVVEEPVELDETEVSILTGLAEVDGARLDVDSIARRIKKPQILTQHTVDMLTDRNLVTVHHNLYDGTSYSLSRTGRARILAEGFVE